MRLILAALALASATGAVAQTYPNKPIRYVIPYPPGGGTDTYGRIVADRLADRLGQPVIVNNVAGGSGTVGSDQVRRADADGYTLLFNASLFLLGKNVLKSTPYDPLEDFTALGRMGEAPLLIVSSTRLEATTLAETLKLAREKPNTFNFAVSGMGSAGHLATLEFLRLAKLDLVTIPYKGTAPAMQDVMGGSAQLFIDPLTVLLPQTRGGKLRALAVTSPTRVRQAPDIPSVVEAGMPGLANMVSWWGVWGPKGLPAPIAQRISAALTDAAKAPELVQRAENLGIVPSYMPPAQFVEFMRGDLTRSVALLKGANFQPD